MRRARYHCATTTALPASCSSPFPRPPGRPAPCQRSAPSGRRPPSPRPPHGRGGRCTPGWRTRNDLKAKGLEKSCLVSVMCILSLFGPRMHSLNSVFFKENHLSLPSEGPSNIFIETLHHLKRVTALIYFAF